MRNPQRNPCILFGLLQSARDLFEEVSRQPANSDLNARSLVLLSMVDQTVGDGVQSLKSLQNLADDPTEALSQLSRMRQQGLITEAEFNAKRAEIIARL